MAFLFNLDVERAARWVRVLRVGGRVKTTSQGKGRRGGERGLWEDIGDGRWRRECLWLDGGQPMWARLSDLGYGALGAVGLVGGFDSCWLRTLTALARHFQQRGESCRKPSSKLTVAHSAERSHQTQVASGCQVDNVTSMRGFFPMRGTTIHESDIAQSGWSGKTKW